MSQTESNDAPEDTAAEQQPAPDASDGNEASEANEANEANEAGPSSAPEATDAAEASDGAAEPVVEAVPEPSREEQLEADLAKMRDQAMRTAADFDNFRKRTRKDLEDAQRRGLERALLEVLPVADNLERAVGAVDVATDVKAVMDGVQMVLKSFADSIGRLGVERVPAMGATFDPTVHEAIQQVPTADAAPGTIVAELVPGYTLGPKLLRAAMVGVATAPPAPAPEAAVETSAAEESTSSEAPPEDTDSSAPEAAIEAEGEEIVSEPPKGDAG